MKRLITREQVADYLKVTASVKMEAHMAAAEWLVAGDLLTSSLHERSVVERHRLRYDLGPDDVLELRDGPATAFDPDSTGAQATFDSLELPVEDLILDYWTIRNDNDGFRRNATGYLRFKAGWTPENAPEPIKQAIIMTAGSLFKHPDQAMIMERIGDYTRQSASLTAGGEMPALTPQVRTLLTRFRRPRI